MAAHDHDGEKSRSQSKREHRALKDLGEELVRLSRRQLDSIPMDEETREAIEAARDMKRAALQRQYRFIAARLAEDDAESIREGLQASLRPAAVEIARLHEAETWRDRLIEGDEDDVAAAMERYADCDRGRLCQLVRNARREREQERAPKSARQLFRYLRELAESP
jgi:ribosome-associated protein